MKVLKLIASLLSAAVIASSPAAVPPSSAGSQTVIAKTSSKLPAPKGITKKSAVDSITLKWKKVSGADAYRVYKYDPVKKKYSAYKDVASCKCTVNGLEAGTSYKFKLAALVKKGGKYYAQTKSAAIKATTKAAAAEPPRTEEAAEITAEFTVSSTDLSGGVWDTVITHTSRGADRSPELSWNDVEGAEEYVVYMLDTSANNWMHWRAYGIKTNHLDAGSASASDIGGAVRNEYIGPYPPSGTHTYVVTVFALKKAADSYPGSFNATNSGIDSIRNALDISGGASGNIIAEASISGTYTSGT